MLICLTAHISMVTYCTLISVLNHLTAYGRNSSFLESRCERNAWRITSLEERWEEACKALQLSLLQLSLVNREMRQMDALEPCNSLGETGDKKALGIWGFSLSNKYLTAVMWQMQHLVSFLLFPGISVGQGNWYWRGPKGIAWLCGECYAHDGKWIYNQDSFTRFSP